MIGLGLRIASNAEFIRRSICALKALELDEENDGFLLDMLRLLERGRTLTSDQRQALINNLHRRRHDMTDTLLIGYVAEQSKSAGR